MSSRINIFDVVELLSLDDGTPPPTDTAMFQRSIAFERVGFAYPAGGKVLHDINLTIAKGERIGIAGTTARASRR